MSPAMTRHLPLQGIENFRDFGDYPTRHGRRLKKGLLYRSAHHHHATPEDLALVADIGPTHIIDLRRTLERQREPSARWADFEAEVIDNDLGHEPEDPWVVKMRTAPLTEEWFIEDAIQFYREAPFLERHIDLFSRYFRALATTGGPIIVHCAAGKDRTGMICALTHHVAGVDEEHIVADFLLTNDPHRTEVRAQRLQEMIERDLGRHVPMAAARAAVMVHEPCLRAALDEMTARCGSIDGYLEQRLGVDAQLREALEARLLD